MRRIRAVVAAWLIPAAIAIAAPNEPPVETLRRPAALLPQPPQGLSPYWLDFERGWFWYEDPAPEPVEPATKPPAKADREAKPPEVVRLETLQKRLENARKVAIINPTEANVLSYMRLEATMIRQASYFADVAQRLGWAHPELDMTLEGRPVNALAIEAYNRDQMSAEARSLGALAASHAIFFFFRSDCPYCKAYAPVLKDFADRYGLKVIAISVDGQGIAEFADWKKDNGIGANLNVDKVPATFLAQPYTGVVTPLGFGVLSQTQLAERIVMSLKPAADKAAQALPPLSRLP